jgi:hypothetical protein
MSGFLHGIVALVSRNYKIECCPVLSDRNWEDSFQRIVTFPPTFDVTWREKGKEDAFRNNF